MVYRKTTKATEVKKKPSNLKDLKKKRLYEKLIADLTQKIKDSWGEVVFCPQCRNIQRPRWMLWQEWMCACWGELTYKEDYPQKIIARFKAKAEYHTKFYKLPTKKAIAPMIPTFKRRSMEQGINDKTREAWASEFEAFGNACEICKDIMDTMITELAMVGKYPANYAIFYQKANLGYEERNKLDIEWSGFNLTLLAEKAEEKEQEKSDLKNTEKNDGFSSTI